MNALAALTRIQSLHAEFDRIAAETIASLKAEEARSIEREQQMSAATHEVMGAIDELLGKLGRAP